MVAASTKNPLRPSSIPYTLQPELSQGYSWIIPEDGLTFHERVKKYLAANEITASDEFILTSWLKSYEEALGKDHVPATSKPFSSEKHFELLLELVRKERKRPHYFNGGGVTGKSYEPANYHAEDSRFFDYQQYGVDMCRPLVDWEASCINGIENLEQIKAQLAKGHNVVFMSNHQSEADTQCIFTLFEDQLNKEYAELARKIVFVAGERVLKDPIVVPFSRGCNLLTVYSKKHIDSEPEIKADKMAHNQRTLGTLGQQFAQGGTCMWFAPSGGRDRRSAATGRVELSQFDVNSIEMMRQVAERARALDKTHFYSMSLVTNKIFPPPATVGGALGEERVVDYSPIRISVSREILDSEFPVDESLGPVEKKAAVKEARIKRCELAMQLCKEGYEAIGGYDM